MKSAFLNIFLPAFRGKCAALLKATVIGIFFAGGGTAFATHVAVLETTADSGVVTLGEKQYLTDVLRSEAIKALPAEQNYTIMTRENINAMLPPGKAIEDCEGSCLVETGKNISADFVAQGHVGKFADNLTITVELYETAGNKLVGSFSSMALDIMSLESEIRQKSPELFAQIVASTYGMVDLQPSFVEGVGHEADLVIKIDGNISKNGYKYMRGQWDLAPGEHSIEFMHPCYNPLQFNVNVLSGKTTVVSNSLDAVMKQLSISTSFKGKSREVPVFVNGLMKGRTPFQGRIPVCSTVEVGEAGFREIVMMEWGDKDKLDVVYALKNAKPTAEELRADSLALAAKKAADEALLAAAEQKRKRERIKNISSMALVALGLASAGVGFYENKVMKDEREKYDSLDEEEKLMQMMYNGMDQRVQGHAEVEKFARKRADAYDRQWDKVKSAQTKR